MCKKMTQQEYEATLQDMVAISVGDDSTCCFEYALAALSHEGLAGTENRPHIVYGYQNNKTRCIHWIFEYGVKNKSLIIVANKGSYGYYFLDLNRLYGIEETE